MNLETRFIFKHRRRTLFFSFLIKNEPDIVFFIAKRGHIKALKLNTLPKVLKQLFETRWVPFLGDCKVNSSQRMS